MPKDDNRDTRLEFLKSCPEPALLEVIFLWGMKDRIPWDGRSKVERAIAIVEDFQGLPALQWTKFCEAVEKVRQKREEAEASGDIYAPDFPGQDHKFSGLPQVKTQLFGRDDEQAALDEAWAEPKPHIIGLVGEGGQGKTVLIHTWLKKFRVERLRGAACVYVHSFYGQSSKIGGSSDAFLAEALHFLDVRDADSDDPREKALRLAKELRKRRTLLILDGLESLQKAAEGTAKAQFEDGGIKTLLQELARGFDGLCVVTSRWSLADLSSHLVGGGYRELSIEPVREEAGTRILAEAAGGTPDSAVAGVARRASFHGLTLRLLGKLAAEFLEGDVKRLPEILPEPQGANEGYTLEAVLEAIDSHLNPQQRCLMRLVGLFDGPAQLKIIRSLWEAPVIEGVTEPIQGMTPEAWFQLAETVRDTGLLWAAADDQREVDELDTHPHIRQFFAKRLESESQAGWIEGHSRIFDRLCKTTEHQPHTPAGLQPLYNAVMHGFLAGRYLEACDKVYRDRILRGPNSLKSSPDGASQLEAVEAVSDSIGVSVDDYLNAEQEIRASASMDVHLRFRNAFALASFINRHISGDAKLHAVFAEWNVSEVVYHPRVTLAEPTKSNAETEATPFQQLLDHLVKLPEPLFYELLVHFDPKKVVSRKAAQRQQVIELLELAQSRIEGMSKLKRILAELRS